MSKINLKIARNRLSDDSETQEKRRKNLYGRLRCPFGFRSFLRPIEADETEQKEADDTGTDRQTAQRQHKNRGK